MPLELRSPEWIALGFFLYLAVAALLMPLPADRKRRAIARAILISAFILFMAVPDGVVAVRARDGLPLVYLLLGYWLPAHLVTSTNPKLEEMLLEFDLRLFGPGGLARCEQGLDSSSNFSRSVLCAIRAPWLHLAGIWGFPQEGDRFWTVLLARSAAAVCYPGLRRAPRVRSRETRPAVVHRSGR
jgi:hypothetical protein